MESKNKVLLKTIYETDENLLKIFNHIRSLEKKSPYSTETLENVIKNPIELKQIFDNNGWNYNKIDYIIWGLPKTGNTSLYNAFSKINNGNLLFFHSIIELLYKDLNFINYSEKDIIDFVEKNNPKVFVIVSYRNPFDNIISRIYHDIKVFETNEIIDKIIDKKDVIMHKFQIDYIYNQIFKEQFNIDFTNIKYNNELGFGLLNYSDKVSFVFTRLEDFSKFSKNVNKIIMFPPEFNFNIECHNKNTDEKYISSNHTFDSEFIDYIINSNQFLLNYYNYDIQEIRNNLSLK